MLAQILVFVIAAALAVWMICYCVIGIFRMIFYPQALPNWLRDDPPVAAASQTHGFPVVVGANECPSGLPEDEAGIFRIIGVDRETSDDVDLRIAAASTANAKVKAELKGVVVTRIMLLEPGNPLDGVPQA